MEQKVNKNLSFLLQSILYQKKNFRVNTIKNRYIFIVNKLITKLEIKYLFENILKIKVKKLNILNLSTKYKKIYITFENDSIFKNKSNL